MEYLVMQIALFLALAALAGSVLGALGTRWVYAVLTNNCRNELSGLRRNYEDMTRENLALRTQVQQMGNALRKISTTASEADYGEYLESRKALENTRRQYEMLLDKVASQDKVVQELRQQLQLRKAELDALRREAAVPSSEAQHQLAPLPAVLEQNDDLTLIHGINQTVARKLRALGIMSYRQVAEFCRDDISRMQRLIGSDIPLPLEEWAQSARQLFQQKYLQT